MENPDKLLTAFSPEDNELVKMYQNGIFFEDYFINFYDKYINLCLSSLNKVFASNDFSENNELKKMNKELIPDNMYISNIGGTNTINNTSSVNNTKAMNVLSSNSIDSDIKEFEFQKNENKNDFANFGESLNLKSTYSTVKVKVVSYFTGENIKNIYDKNLKSKQIAASMINHFIIPNQKRNPEIFEIQSTLDLENICKKKI